jgi:hypothetical protein
VEVATEKLDLRDLFEPVCRQFHIPLTNFKGWSDLNSRAAMMRRFKYWQARGKKCILLVCGDHDPGGLLITETMRKNLEDLSGAVGWSPTNLKCLDRYPGPARPLGAEPCRSAEKGQGCSLWKLMAEAARVRRRAQHALLGRVDNICSRRRLSVSRLRCQNALSHADDQAPVSKNDNRHPIRLSLFHM